MGFTMSKQFKVPVNTVSLSQLQIYSENQDEIIAFCAFHNDTKRPNLIVNKTGEFAGRYHCFSCGADGWVTDIKKKFRKSRKKNFKRDFYSIWLECTNSTPYQSMELLAKEWNVNIKTLIQYGYGWATEKLQKQLKCKTTEACHIFPMFIQNRIVGIQRTFLNGRKVSMPGSKLGLFAPLDLHFKKKGLYITEGRSDAICCADLGFTAIGRPNATAIPEVVVEWCLTYVPKYVPITIIRDNDECGEDGGEKLLSILRKIWNTCIVVPRESDLRAEIKAYGKSNVERWLEV